MLFAGADAYMERHLAKLDVPHLPSAIRAFCRLPVELEDRYRLKLEVQRDCEAVEVPGLSTEALAAIVEIARSEVEACDVWHGTWDGQFRLMRWQSNFRP